MFCQQISNCLAVLIRPSYIPLLLLPIPLSLSPVHLTILLSLTYILNRPCLYCSLLLIILFATSCHWSQTCLVDFSYVPVAEGGSGHATWFIPRFITVNEKSWNVTRNNETVSYLASALADSAVAGINEVAARMRGKDIFTSTNAGYLSSFFAFVSELLHKEWTVPCIGTRIIL